MICPFEITSLKTNGILIIFLTNGYRNEDTDQVFLIYHFNYHIFALRAMQILSMGEGDKCEKQT